jgi:hypothetical protein
MVGVRGGVGVDHSLQAFVDGGGFGSKKPGIGRPGAKRVQVARAVSEKVEVSAAKSRRRVEIGDGFILDRA